MELLPTPTSEEYVSMVKRLAFFVDIWMQTVEKEFAFQSTDVNTRRALRSIAMADVISFLRGDEGIMVAARPKNLRRSEQHELYDIENWFTGRVYCVLDELSATEQDASYFRRAAEGYYVDRWLSSKPGK